MPCQYYKTLRIKYWLRSSSYDDNIQRYENAMQLHHEQLQQRKKMRILSQMGFPNLAGSSPAMGYPGPSPALASPGTGAALALPGPGAGHSASMAAPRFGNVGASMFGGSHESDIWTHRSSVWPCCYDCSWTSWHHRGAPSSSCSWTWRAKCSIWTEWQGQAQGLEMQGQAQHQLRCLFSGEKMMPMSRSLHLVF